MDRKLQTRHVTPEEYPDSEVVKSYTYIFDLLGHDSILRQMQIVMLPHTLSNFKHSLRPSTVMCVSNCLRAFLTRSSNFTLCYIYRSEQLKCDILLQQGYTCKKCGNAFHSQCLNSSRPCTTDEKIYSTLLENVSSGEELPQPVTPSAASGNENHPVSADLLEGQPWYVKCDVMKIVCGRNLEFFININIRYGGIMGAEDATRLLRETHPGTFMIRSRNPETPDAFSAPYALSVKYIYEQFVFPGKIIQDSSI